MNHSIWKEIMHHTIWRDLLSSHGYIMTNELFSPKKHEISPTTQPSLNTASTVKTNYSEVCARSSVCGCG